MNGGSNAKSETGGARALLRRIDEEFFMWNSYLVGKTLPRQVSLFARLWIHFFATRAPRARLERWIC